MATKITKFEAGADFPAEDYADVPDLEKPSTWKLRLTESPGRLTVAQIARAITAMQPGGFRGQQVEIGTSKAEVAKRINAAIGKVEGDESQKEGLRQRLSAVKTTDEDEKCGESLPMAPSPMYGGATSFAEVDTWMASMREKGKIEEQTYVFNDLVRNIQVSDELSIAEKASRIAAAAALLPSRVSNPPEYKTVVAEEEAAEDDEKVGKRLQGNWKAKVKDALATLAKFLNWSDYDEEEMPKEGMMADEKKELEEPVSFNIFAANEPSGFKVFRDKAGHDRWLAFSSNAFRDREGEVFTTKALQTAVEEADKTGHHGTLRLFHVPSSDVGTCDFQEVVGRFLVESGIFDDTDKGRRAAQYFKASDQDYGVSIGYRYEKADRADKVYDWLEIFERSVAPRSAVANPWTTFKTAGGGMDSRKKAFLTEVLGETLTKEVIETAETQTKELEGQVAYKELGGKVEELISSVSDPELKAKLEEHTTAIKALLDGDVKEEAKEETPVEATAEAEVETESVALTKEDVVEAIQEATQPLSQAIEELASSHKEFEEKTAATLIELQRSEDEKVADLFFPRTKVPVGQKAPSQDDGNVIDPNSDIAKAVAEETKEGPAAPFMDQLKTVLGVSA